MLISGRWMLLVFLIAWWACSSPGVQSDQPGPGDDEVELAAIQETVDLTYRVSSFDDPASADPEDFRRPFTPTATLAFTRDGEIVERTVDEYVEIRRRLLESGEIQSLEEWELAGETDFFGNIAHRMSSYAVRVDGSPELAERGVMSFQLLNVDGNWKVHSLTWHAESPDHPVPARHTSSSTAQSLAFKDVTVIDVVDGVAVAGQTVVVAGGRIAAVGPSDEVLAPTGATVIDGRGKFLIPGLWDMHVHMANEESALVPWDFHAPDPEEADPREIYLPVYIAFGVTGIREMSGGRMSVRMRDRIRDGDLLGPHMVVGSPLLDGPQPVFPDAAVLSIDDAESGRAAVTALHEQGFDFLKPYTYLSADAYRALHQRAGELGMDVAGELPISVSVWEAAELGQRSVEHLTGLEFGCSKRENALRRGYVARIRALNADPSSEDRMDIWYRSEWEPLESIDPRRCEDLLAHLASNGTWVVPTLVIQRIISYPEDPRVARDPNLRYLDPASRDAQVVAEYFDPERRLRPLYDHRMRMIPELHRAGVGVLAGSDQPGGFSLHQELEIFVESGLTPLDALRTATINPARYLRREQDLGSIASGKIADLVLLAGDPLEDISNTQRIEAVVFQGHLRGRDQLDEMLQQLAIDAENWPE